MKKVLKFQIFLLCITTFTSFSQLIGQTVNADLISPQGGSGSDYKWVRIGDGSSFWGGIMWNNTSTQYGNGNDLSIYTYDNRDLTFRTGTGNVIFFPSSGGFVGIGTQTPANKLELRGGDFYTDGSIKWGSARLSYSYPYNQIKWGDNTNWYLSFNRGTDDEKLFTMRSSDGLAYFKGSVGIGTESPGYKLDVIGTIRAKEIKVDLNGADFVFEKAYKLMPLDELEQFVSDKQHLPDVAPASEMKENGTDLGDLNSKLLQKIEELTLYVIEQNKKIEKQSGEIQLLKNEIDSMKVKVSSTE